MEAFRQRHDQDPAPPRRRFSAQPRDYGELLRNYPAEVEALVRNIPIHVTEFFRDSETWQVVVVYPGYR